MFRSDASASCLLCSCPTDSHSALCSACLLELPYLDCPCRRCALELGLDAPSHAYCEQCLIEPPFFDYCFALGRYEYPLQELITRFKFNAKLCAGRALSLALLREKGFSIRQDPPDALLPVPLHAQRIRHRGFNQSIVMANALSSSLGGIPVLRQYCQRLRATSTQRGLSASERGVNLRDAFVITQPDTRWQHIAIVDDVVTTKSTVNAIAQLLKNKGVKKVGVICLARVSEAPKTDT